MYACKLIYSAARDAIFNVELDGKMVVNGEIENIWKFMVMHCFKIGLVPRHLSEVTEEIHEVPYSG
jgi:hypothetical protein